MVKSLNKFVTNAAIPVLLARFTGDFYQPFTTANYVGDKLSLRALFKGTRV
jgi:hypothetical protein